MLAIKIKSQACHVFYFFFFTSLLYPFLRQIFYLYYTIFASTIIAFMQKKNGVTIKKEFPAKLRTSNLALVHQI